MTDRVIGGGPGPRQRCWLWTAKAEFYLADSGEDHPDLVPREEPEPETWWTCTKGTRAGDLALLYRAKNDGPTKNAGVDGVAGKDIAFLIEVCSDAFPLNDEIADEYGWRTGCYFSVIEKFEKPLRIEEMRDDPVLGNWSALRGNFQGKAREVPAEIWDRILTLVRSH